MRRQFWEGKPLPQIAKDFGISHCYCWQVCNFYRLRKEVPPDFRPRSRFYSGAAATGDQADVDSHAVRSPPINDLKDQAQALPIRQAPVAE